MGFKQLLAAMLLANLMQACIGPDMGSAKSVKNSSNDKNGGGGVVVVENMPLPVMVNPPAAYLTTSNIMLIQAGNEPTATSYLFEALSGSTVLASQTLTSAGVDGMITLPAASYGTITMRLSYLNSAGVRSAYTSNDITYLNFAAGTLVKSIDFTAQPSCGTCLTMSIAGCAGVSWPLTCPSFPNNDWLNCQADGSVATGNAWICSTDGAQSLFTNNNQAGTYNPANLSYDYTWQDVSMTSTSYQKGHGASATNEAILTSCRMKKSSECGMGGYDSGISFWYYPYRDANSSDNVEIAQRDCSGNWTILAKARVTAINLIGQSPAVKLNSKVDCFGDYFTAYYKSGADYIPIAIVKDQVKFAGRAGWGFGPGHPTNVILHRVSAFEWRHW